MSRRSPFECGGAVGTPGERPAGAAGYDVDRVEHAETGAVHGRIFGALDATLMFGVGAAFDFHARASRPGAAVDAAFRAGMVFSAVQRAAPVVETLFEE